MKAHVSLITPCHNVSGQFQGNQTDTIDGMWNSVEEYAATVARQNRWLYVIDPDIADIGDDDEQQLAARLREVCGAVQGGHDTLVAYLLGDGSIIVESVAITD